ncbi:NUDIX hydrolase [Filimonas effusa]|uniref:NUDIX domain-containing protein n=1 Tax=Filimonas effusa TaxID=2508721 RepID=A0A4Q1DB77_9BACT|nr:NUDIX hydrolase [Filimonas effusa]RXK85823.1 NUDIX domain-containing protein [Filimonas effusa]
MNELLNLVKRVKSIADIGLLYSKDPYDRDRYQELHEIALALTSQVVNTPLEEVKAFYGPVTDYPTPKVDIRGMLLNDKNEVLLARESADGKWSLPGGWGDIGLTPSEVIVKEFVEETGLDVSVNRLLAVFDKKMHPHPYQPYYVYKFVFLCELKGDLQFNKGFDMLDAAFFPIDQLPELSLDRILPSQVEVLHHNAINEVLIPIVD